MPMTLWQFLHDLTFGQFLGTCGLMLCSTLCVAVLIAGAMALVKSFRS